MLQSSIPTKIDIVWASQAGGSFTRPIPDTVQQPTFPFAASYPAGFPPDTFLAPGAGGEGPDGRDMNGILQALSGWAQWQAAGGQIGYDGTFQASIGGYPKGALIASATTQGLYWLSTSDSNTTNPDASGAGWVNFFASLTGGNNTWTGTNAFSAAVSFTGTVGLGALASATTSAANSNNTGVATNAYADRAAATALSTAETFATTAANNAEAAAISTSETFATGAANTAQSNAETYAAAQAAAAESAAISTSEAYAKALIYDFENVQGGTVQQFSAPGGTLSPSLTFSTTLGGIVHITGSKNLAGIDSGIAPGTLKFDGASLVSDTTNQSMSHSAANGAAGGTHTVSYVGTSIAVNFSVDLSFIFIPFHPSP